MNNKWGREELKRKRDSEQFIRISLSFYKYFLIEEPIVFRNELYRSLFSWDVLGRIYVSKEGINAQVQIPDGNLDIFEEYIRSFKNLKDIYFNFSPSSSGQCAFLKLIIKCREKLVADGLEKPLDISQKKNYILPSKLNQAIQNKNSILVDVRNHYESEVGHFKNSLFADAENFRETMNKLPNMLADHKDKKIILYCTGGIRCEKASVYLKENGFEDVSQIKGGITSYLNYIKKNNIDSKFIGKNFVFNERLQEHIHDKVIACCHQCSSSCDSHVNCKNDACHLLFIQCRECATKYNSCCSAKCKEIASLPKEEQKQLRKGKKNNGVQHYKKNRDTTLV